MRAWEREAYDAQLDRGRTPPRCRVCEGGKGDPCCEECDEVARLVEGRETTETQRRTA